jgi:hypothetical protein
MNPNEIMARYRGNAWDGRYPEAVYDRYTTGFGS